MSLKILNQYFEEDIKVIEYTKDGNTVSHTVKTPINMNQNQNTVTEPTLNERLYAIELSAAQTQIQVDYLAFMTELATMKGGEK